MNNYYLTYDGSSYNTFTVYEPSPSDEDVTFVRNTNNINIVPLIIIIVLSIIVFIVDIVGLMRILKKAGKPSWSIFIPIYNIIVLLQAASLPTWYVILTFIPIANFVVSYKMFVKFASICNQPKSIGVLTFFIPELGIPILAFSKSEQVHQEKKKQYETETMDDSFVFGDSKLVSNTNLNETMLSNDTLENNANFNVQLQQIQIDNSSSNSLNTNSIGEQSYNQNVMEPISFNINSNVLDTGMNSSIGNDGINAYDNTSTLNSNQFNNDYFGESMQFNNENNKLTANNIDAYDNSGTFNNNQFNNNYFGEPMQFNNVNNNLFSDSLNNNFQHHMSDSINFDSNVDQDNNFSIDKLLKPQEPIEFASINNNTFDNHNMNTSVDIFGNNVNDLSVNSKSNNSNNIQDGFKECPNCHIKVRNDLDVCFMCGKRF